MEGGATGEDERPSGHRAEPEAAGEAERGGQRECSGWAITEWRHTHTLIRVEWPANTY